jgi:hypothetical protein
LNACYWTLCGDIEDYFFDTIVFSIGTRLEREISVVVK